MAQSQPCQHIQSEKFQVDEWVKVKKVIDGDTVHLSDGRKVRLIGINTPEMGYKGKTSQPYARKAFNTLKEILREQEEIGLQFDQQRKDKYQRILAYSYLRNGQNIESLLLQKGLAISIVVPPNDRHLNCYRQIERQAREAGLGIWSLPENKLISADDLAKNAKGYRFVFGTINQYEESKKNSYLKLNQRLTIRIPKYYLEYFNGVDLQQLPGKPVRVRGWLNHYKKKQFLTISNPADINYN